MERKRAALIFFTLCLTVAINAADNRSDIYNAYINGRMADWKAVIDSMEKERNKDNGFTAELLNYQYGYIGWCLANNHNDEAGRYLLLAWNNLEILEDRGVMPSDVNAYMSALYGFSIGLNPIKTPFLGPRSITCAERAIQLDNGNPNGYIQYANTLFYRPESFGGSKSTAIINYVRALELMEDSSECLEEDWNYLSLLVTIAKAYQDTGDYVKAKQYFEKALKVEPRFTWVRDELYPALLKEMK